MVPIKKCSSATGMEYLLNLDQQTMFMVNALLLVVFAAGFAFAGLGYKDRRYWGYLVASNVIFAVAFVIFSRQIDGTPEALLLPNCLLVIGLGLRWQAIRSFFGHRSSSAWFVALGLVMAVALMLSDVVGNGVIFGLTNGIIAAQIGAIMVSLALEREQFLSRWGLIVAYGAVAASSILRVVQGLLLDRGMDSLLPADIFLDLNLVAAAVHIGASGAFSLSLAYERIVAELRETVLRDPLTGLYNRRCFDTLSEVSGHKGARRDSAVVLIDIDHFKRVNDKYGHAAGDEAIRHCADVVRRIFGQDNLIARIGGEEFVVLLPGRDLAHACGLAEDLRAAIETEMFSFQGKRIELTVSIGISCGMADSHSFERLLQAADACLYQAKAKGRNRVEVDGRTVVPNARASGRPPMTIGHSRAEARLAGSGDPIPG